MGRAVRMAFFLFLYSAKYQRELTKFTWIFGYVTQQECDEIFAKISVKMAKRDILKSRIQH